jgi:hypothetical protein
MTVICIENIIKTENNSLFIGRQFNQTSDLYSYPFRSSCYHIYSVSLLSDRLEAWPIDLFQVKLFNSPFLHEMDLLQYFLCILKITIKFNELMKYFVNFFKPFLA